MNLETEHHPFGKEEKASRNRRFLCSKSDFKKTSTCIFSIPIRITFLFHFFNFFLVLGAAFFFPEGSFGCWPSLPGSIGTSLRLDAELLRRLPSAWCCLDGRQHGQLEAWEIRGDSRIVVET